MKTPARLAIIGLTHCLLDRAASMAAQVPDSVAAAVSVSPNSQRPAVSDAVRYLTGPAKDRMAVWLERHGQYRDLIRKGLERQGLPTEFEFLPLIESGYSNSAVSRAGAVGMWQFIPTTARRYGLRIDRFVDERRDPIRATDAATRHLADLSREFGSPLLAAAAYNGGSGRVRRGLARLGDSEIGTVLDSRVDGSAFFSLADNRLLPKETRGYVPGLLAAATIGADPIHYGFFPVPRDPIAFDSVLVRRPVSLAETARSLGIGAKFVAELNPQLIRGVTPPGAATWLRVPSGLGPKLSQRLATIPTAKTSVRPKQRIRVVKGQSLEDVAALYQVELGELRRVNALPRWYRLRPGQILWLPAAEAP